MTTARDERKTKTNVYGVISDLLLEIEKREHKIFQQDDTDLDQGLG